MSGRWAPRLLAAGLLLLPLSRVVAGEEGAKEKVIFPRTAAGASGTEARAESPSPTKAMLGLALVCAAAGGWLLWRRRSAGTAAGVGGRKLKVVETQGLGNRQFLVVADYDGRKILLGVCPGRIELLTHLSDGDEDES